MPSFLPGAVCHARTSPRPSSALMWRAIMSSSLVGITHAEVRLCARVIRGPPRGGGPGGGAPGRGRAGPRGAPRADPRRPLADPRAEDERVDPAEHGGEPADLPRGAVDEVVDGQARAGLGAREQVAHVVAD